MTSPEDSGVILSEAKGRLIYAEIRAQERHNRIGQFIANLRLARAYKALSKAKSRHYNLAN